MNRKWLKRIGIGFGVLFGLLIAAAIILPLVIDVDKYRPQIVAAANENINGKLELGKLKLNLWGRIKIEVDGIQVTDARSRKVLSVKDVFFHIPFSSILAGAPNFELKMEKPELFVVKEKSGKMNVLTLVKPPAESGAATTAPGKETTGEASKKSESTSVPAIVRRARLGIEMKQAHLSYSDEATQLVSEVKDLNVLIKNLSLSKAMDAEISANLDTRMGNSLTVKGPAAVTAHVEPSFNGSEFERAVIDAKMNMDGVEIMMPGLFEKKAGMDANAGAKMEVTKDSAKISDLYAKFFNVKITGQGSVVKFAAPEFEMHLKSNDVELKPWNQLIPMLKEYELGGIANFDAELNGSAAIPRYRANLGFKEITAKAPNLKAQPRFDGHVRVVTDQIESMLLTMKAPANDLKIAGKMVSFTKPRLDATVTSTGMDLDQLIEFPKAKVGETKGSAPTAGAPSSEGKPAASGAAPSGASNFDALLDPLRKNQIAIDTTAFIKFSFPLLKAYNVKMTDMNGQMSMKSLNVSLDAFSMNLFNGKIKGTGTTQMMPKTPTYRFSTDVAGLDLQEAVASQFALFKDTLVGKAFFKMDGSGSSYNPEPAMKNLNAKGTLRIENAKFATIDIAKMVSEALNKSIGQIAEKVPALKGKTIQAPGNFDSRYETVTGDFTISNGRFDAPNFVAKAVPNKGIDLKGNTQLGLVDRAIVARWDVIDTYNLTHARDLSVDQAGIRVEHILAEGNEPVKLPILVTGTASAPQFSYTSVPEALGKVALSNVGNALAGKAKAEASKQAKQQLEQLSKKAPAPLQDAIKKFGGGLFGK